MSPKPPKLSLKNTPKTSPKPPNKGKKTENPLVPNEGKRLRNYLGGETVQKTVFDKTDKTLRTTS